MRRLSWFVLSALAMSTVQFGASHSAYGAGAQLPLEECTAEHRALSVLFLVDTSMSLEDTDRGNERVAALQLAISVLAAQKSAENAATGEEFPVFVDVLSFGTTTERTFAGRWDEWMELPTGGDALDGVLADVEVFGSLNKSLDTDYVAALEPYPWYRQRPASDTSVGALELLARSPANSCRLVVWFTDGKLDFDPVDGRTRSISWTDRPLRWESDAAALVEDGANRLCGADDLVARLRSGDISSPGGEGAQLAVVALGSDASRFDLIRRVAEDPACSNVAPRGRLYQAQDVKDLLFSLQLAVGGSGDGVPEDRLPTCRMSDACLPVDTSRMENYDYPFTLTPGISSFNLVALEGDAGVDTYLVSPSGEPLRIDTAGVDQPMANGTLVSVNPFKGNDLIHLVRAELPDDPSGWQGTWRVRFVARNPAGGDAVNRAALYVFAGDFQVKLRNDGGTVRRGRTATLVLELTTQGGAVVSKPEIMPMPSLSVRIGGVAVDPGAELPDGTWQFEYPVAEDAPLETLAVTADLEIRVRIDESLQEVPLRTWTGIDAGSVVVGELPKYPLIDGEIRRFDGDLSQKRDTVSSRLTVAAVGKESAGCIELVDIANPTGGDRDLGGVVRVFDGEREVLAGQQCPIRLVDDEERELRIEVSVEKGRVASEATLRGSLTFRSISSLDPQQSETLVKEFSASVVPAFDIDVDWPRAIWLTLLALLGALAVLYLLNIVGAQLAIGEGAIVSIPVLVSPGKVERRAEHGMTKPLTFDDDEIDVLGLRRVGRRARSVEFDGVRIEADVPASPFGEVMGRAAVRDRRFVVSRFGSSKNGSKGRLGATTTNAWVFSAEERPVKSADAFEPLAGSLTMVLPPDPQAARAAMSKSEEEVRTTLSDQCRRFATAKQPDAEDPQSGSAGGEVPSVPFPESDEPAPSGGVSQSPNGPFVASTSAPWMSGPSSATESDQRSVRRSIWQRRRRNDDEATPPPPPLSPF